MTASPTSVSRRVSRGASATRAMNDEARRAGTRMSEADAPVVRARDEAAAEQRSRSRQHRARRRRSARGSTRRDASSFDDRRSCDPASERADPSTAARRSRRPRPRAVSDRGSDRRAAAASSCSSSCVHRREAIAGSIDSARSDRRHDRRGNLAVVAGRPAARRRTPACASRRACSPANGASPNSAAIDADREAELIARRPDVLAAKVLGRHVASACPSSSRPSSDRSISTLRWLGAHRRRRRGDRRARPKSRTRGRPSWPTSTLSGLKSRWMIPRACAAASPRPAATYIASASRQPRSFAALPVGERLAGDELHRDEHLVAVLADLVDRHDVRVRDLRHRLRLAQQARARLRRHLRRRGRA